MYVYRYAFIMVGNIDVIYETIEPNMTIYDYEWLINDLCFQTLLKAKRKRGIVSFSVAISGCLRLPLYDGWEYLAMVAMTPE